MKTILDLLAEKHNDWIRIVKSFGCNRDTAEDIVQEMYIKMHILVNKGTNIMYNDTEINHFYVYRTLRTMFIDLTRKQSKIKMFSIDNQEEFSEYISLLKNIEQQESSRTISLLYDEINKELEKLHWYDKKIYKYIEGGETIKSLSEKTKISYYSIYNTYRKVKKILLEKL
jgi:RNA polymerase sigma factor (sigma-70 family)